MKKPSPLATAILGLAAGVIALGFVLAAHRLGLALTQTTQDGLIFGGLASMGVGAWGAFKTPTGGEKS